MITRAGGRAGGEGGGSPQAQDWCACSVSDLVQLGIDLPSFLLPRPLCAESSPSHPDPHLRDHLAMPNGSGRTIAGQVGSGQAGVLVLLTPPSVMPVLNITPTTSPTSTAPCVSPLDSLLGPLPLAAAAATGAPPPFLLPSLPSPPSLTSLSSPSSLAAGFSEIARVATLLLKSSAVFAASSDLPDPKCARPTRHDLIKVARQSHDVRTCGARRGLTVALRLHLAGGPTVAYPTAARRLAGRSHHTQVDWIWGAATPVSSFAISEIGWRKGRPHRYCCATAAESATVI